METKFIAGPCVIESAELLDAVAERLVAINRALGTDIIFKASFDKANRTSLSSFRGPGLEKGLQMLADVRAKWGLRLLTDIHEAWQAAPVGEVVDVIQIPAFLCRQTDLLVAAARTGRIVNIKKAQFLSGADMRYPYEKAFESAPRNLAHGAGQHLRLQQPGGRLPQHRRHAAHCAHGGHGLHALGAAPWSGGRQDGREP